MVSLGLWSLLELTGWVKAGFLGFCWASLQEHDWGVLCGNRAGVQNSHVPQVAVGRVPARGALGEGSGKLLASLGHFAETPKSSWGNHTGFKEYCRLLLFLTPLHFSRYFLKTILYHLMKQSLTLF